MRKLALIFALIASGSASADAITAGELYSSCNAKDEKAQTACRFYILGAVQGITFGDGSVMSDKGAFVARDKTHFCVPNDMPQSQMLDLFQKAVQQLERAYPEDLKLPATSVIGAAMYRTFPCPNSN
jgi:Rap1a immunity proteins